MTKINTPINRQVAQRLEYIDDIYGMSTESDKRSKTAEERSIAAKQEAENTQAQIDEVARGATNAETSQARVTEDGRTFGTLRDRLNGADAEVSAQLAQTDELLADTVKNKVEWINAVEYGIKNDGTDQTVEVNKLLLDVINSGGGEVYFPGGIYNANIHIHHSDLNQNVVGGKKWLNLKIIGDYNSTVFTAEKGEIMHIEGELGAGFNRITMTGFSLQDVWFDGMDNDVTGLKLTATQHMTYHTMRLYRCNYHGIHLVDAWDVSWTAIDISWCGLASKGGYRTNYAAIYMRKEIDNCNNHKMVNFRIENCPIVLWSDGRNRHNYAVNWKVEKSYINEFEVRPIHIINNLELAFVNCEFINRAVGHTGALEMDQNYFYINDALVDETGLNGLHQSVKFTNCDFTCPPAITTRWGYFKNTKFVNCDIAQAEGGHARYPLEFAGNVEMIATNIRTLNGERAIFFSGDNNRADVSLDLDHQNFTRYSTFRFDYDRKTNQRLKNNQITYFVFNGEVAIANLVSFTSQSMYTNEYGMVRLESNQIKDKTVRRVTAAATGTPDNKIGAEVIYLDTQNLTDINYLYNQQVVTVIPTQGDMNVRFNPGRIVTKTRQDVTVLQNSAIQFIYANGVLHEL